MNKQELMKKIALDAGSDVSPKQIAFVLDSAMHYIMETVAAGEKVRLVGFGTFEARKREARTGVNPRTKEKVEIPASTAPAFKPGKVFKDIVNG